MKDVKKHYEPVKKYLDSHSFRNNRIWKLRGGQFFTIVDGKEMTEKEFDKLYPTFAPVALWMNPSNCDKRLSYLS